MLKSCQWSLQKSTAKKLLVVELFVSWLIVMIIITGTKIATS